MRYIYTPQEEFELGMVAISLGKRLVPEHRLSSNLEENMFRSDALNRAPYNILAITELLKLGKDRGWKVRCSVKNDDIFQSYIEFFKIQQMEELDKTIKFQLKFLKNIASPEYAQKFDEKIRAVHAVEYVPICRFESGREQAYLFWIDESIYPKKDYTLSTVGFYRDDEHMKRIELFDDLYVQPTKEDRQNIGKLFD